MKIAHFIGTEIPPLTYGGSERVLCTLASSQIASGAQVEIFARGGSGLEGSTLSKCPESAEDWKSFALQTDHDVLHFHFPVPQDFLNHHQKQNVLVTIHGNGKPDETFHQNAIFVSENHAKRHGAVAFVHNGIDVKNYPFKTFNPHLSRNNKTLLFLAKASWSVKNLRGSIDLAKKASHELEVVGGNRPWTLQGLTASHTHFHGMLNDADKIAVIQKCRALVFPVLWDEPFGLAVVEAMACGLGVFGTKRGSLPEIVDSECGFLSNDLNDLCRAIANNPQPKAEYVRERVNTHFSALSMFRKYQKYYEDVAKGVQLNPTIPRTVSTSEK